jgi:hypothetical protein
VVGELGVSKSSSAEFQLQAFLADNDAGEKAWTVAPIELVNHRLLHCALADQPAPQATYDWTLDDATVIGLPDIDHRDAAKVFAVALSVQSWRVLHSPVILSTVSLLHIVRRGLLFTGGVGTKLTTRVVTVDEGAFVEAGQALKSVWIMGEERGKVMREALNSYWDALHSVRARSRFLNLWAAFERAVNDDGRRRDAGKFDEHAASATSFGSEEIKPLRDLTRQLKHADALVRADTTLPQNMGPESARLKRLVDHALAARLRFSLSATYDA